EPANAYGTTNGDKIDISIPEKYNLESAVYLGNSQRLSSSISVDYGIRYSHFASFGPGTQYAYNDTIPGRRKTPGIGKDFKRGEVASTYENFEPRLAFKAELNDVTSIKASYNRLTQYLHLISNTTASNPLDVWTPSSN